ncbi:MAG: hypothetical protein P8Y54_11880 [Xanthomonadales bacterium]
MAFLDADLDHREKFRVRKNAVLGIRFEPLRQALAQPDQRIQQADHQRDGIGRKRGQFLPVHGAQGLGNDFRKNQDGQRHDGRHQERGDHRMRFGPDQRGLRADADRADGVRDRVQGQDRGQRPVDILLEAMQLPPGAASVLHLDLGVAWRDAEQRGLPQGAQERGDDGQQKKGEKQ